jgi:hypothetical protein
MLKIRLFFYKLYEIKFMADQEIDKLRFPIGEFHYSNPVSDAELNEYINDMENLTKILSKEVAHLNEEQLNTPYRDGGWTIKQLVHHIADSHLNGYIRAKLLVTEDTPTIKPYDQDRWSDLEEVSKSDVKDSIIILDGLHKRWVTFLRTLTPEDFEKEYFHPEHGISISLRSSTASYGWHCKHHVAHITNLKKKMGWN